MKFICDFNGVLFNAKEFIKFMYDYLEKTGTPRSITEEYYKKVGGTQFGLKEMLSHFSIDESFYEKKTVVFVDDKAKYFENLDFEKYPNLKTILYDDQGLEKLKREIK